MPDASASPTLAFLGTPGRVRMPERFDDETLLKVLGANSGNLMFQYAATLILGGEQRHISLAEIPYSDTSVLSDAQALIFPAANHLRLGADWTGLNNYFAGANKPLIVFGLGAQSPKLGGERETIAALKADPHVTRMVDIFRERAAFVSVRGPYSAEVCAELGLRDVHVLGCPSAMINPDPRLGQKIQAAIEAARNGTDALDIAMTAAAPFEIRGDAPKQDLERKIFGWLYETGGLYVQQSGGRAAMNATNGRWHRIQNNARKSIHATIAPETDLLDFWAFMSHRGRFYLGVPDWMDEMAPLDLCFGTRLHGNMAAIAAGTPGIIIAHDSRTGELGETMHLPRLSMERVMAAGSLREALAGVAFEGAAFDAWRAETARTLTAALTAADIPLSGHLSKLAG